ncbi:Crp/Fnr family transcriptional regulator [Phytomonospora endophytica]|uniref:CRP-like cAMP-binding protein n=1 Tax=Phytomonospora endophytica TaxID=714109 RepID=A0A841FKK6_9ACTN|nr:Crp/Fnr family transcriptional regulator [Phytomonospora endophytica]MBB6036696.1 CRP-like cAMP-binding protein [Phytomonospora endophytica]GIG66017.1 Crp/Fnr family transcriptional regulator [Phytomonospora endophytica]
MNVSELERIGTRFERPAGQILIEDGEHSDHALFLLSGYVVIRIGAPKRSVAIRPPLSFVGEMAAIDQERRTARVAALTQVSAISIPGPLLIRYLQERPDVMLGLLRETSRRFLETSRKYVGSDLSGELKVAATLVDLLDLGIGASDAAGIRLAFSQRDIGELSGISRESAAKAIGEFKRRGLVEVGRGSITVLSAEVMRRIAGSETER